MLILKQWISSYLQTLKPAFFGTYMSCIKNLILGTMPVMCTADGLGTLLIVGTMPVIWTAQGLVTLLSVALCSWQINKNYLILLMCFTAFSQKLLIIYEASKFCCTDSKTWFRFGKYYKIKNINLRKTKS